MSLRGEHGIAREPGRSWYLQSWLLLALAGLICSMAAWRIIEPHMHEFLRFQGPLKSMEIFDEVRHSITWKGHQLSIDHGVIARLDFEQRSVWLLKGVREYQGGHSGDLLNVHNLQQGDDLRLYISEDHFQVLPMAFLVDPDPPPPDRTWSVELEAQLSETRAAGLLLFGVVAGMIGLGIGAVDGLACRLFRRAMLCGFVGLLVGFVGGFLANIAASAIYSPISSFALELMGKGDPVAGSSGFALQVLGRMLAWALAGSAMGLGQGLALRSYRLVVYGFIGGIVGGLLGGMFFDPIDFILLGRDNLGAGVSRGVGLALIGICVGGMIGVVELLARDAWLRMVQGPLKGKEFLLFKDVMQIGSSSKSDLYLFNDPRVAPHHALIRAVGEEYEIEARGGSSPVIINGSTVSRARLRDGDQVAIGDTIFSFKKRKTS